MRRSLLVGLGFVLAVALSSPGTALAFIHPGAGAVCSQCHGPEAAAWKSPLDLHSADATAVLTNTDHNSAELLTDSCIKCHSAFQYPYGVASMVTPIDQTGPWSLLAGASTWQATKCEVCHDANSTAPDKLAKYGAWLDGDFQRSYIALASALPTASVHVFAGASYGSADYADQTTVTTQATRLCDSCHDPDDQGGDPSFVKGAKDYGPQGGDSRAYVTAHHAGFACIDCHPDHTFRPIEDPRTVAACNGTGCHTAAGPLVIGSVTDPGVVHINHIEAADVTRLRLTASATRLLLGRYFTLTSTLYGAPSNATVVFQVRKYGTTRWLTLATRGVVSGIARCRFRTTHRGLYAYRVVYRGTSRATSSVSPSRWVRVL